MADGFPLPAEGFILAAPSGLAPGYQYGFTEHEDIVRRWLDARPECRAWKVRIEEIAALERTPQPD